MPESPDALRSIYEIVTNIVSVPQSRQKAPGGTWYKRQNINHRARALKAQSHSKNLQERANTNRNRSNGPSTNPNFHGMGYHALGKVRQQKRRASFLRKMESKK